VHITELLPVTCITSKEKYHFFGYYDKAQWDISGRYILALEVDFMDRSPSPSDVVRIGMIDTESNYKFIPLGKTQAWCWQQGCMLQWLPGSASEIVYNHRISDRFVAIVQDAFTGRRRTLPRPIYTISNDGKKALSLNFSRLAITRPGYGYNGLVDIWHDHLHPSEDGIYSMDMETGNHELIISLNQLYNYQKEESMEGAKHWVNHLLFSPDDSRFIFLHRWLPPGDRKHRTRFFTANSDGTDLHLSKLQGGSHFIWCDEENILIWGYLNDITKDSAYYICRDGTQEIRPMAKGLLNSDGHCTVAPKGTWVLTDSYPNKEHKRALILYNQVTGQRIDIGYFYSPPVDQEELRCDLHPCWNRTGDLVCIDSVHEGSRQMYVIDVSKFTS
jgi:hypothetical protein